MSRTIRLLTDEDALHWPRLCARCGAAEPMRSAEAVIAARKSSGPGLGNAVLSVDYPICKRHARWLPLAQWLTRDTLAPRTLRGLSYALVGGSALALGLNLVALPPADSAQWLAAGAVLAPLLLVAWAYRATPVRLTGLDRDAVTIRFGSEPYAHAFAQANSKILVKRRAPAG